MTIVILPIHPEHEMYAMGIRNTIHALNLNPGYDFNFNLPLVERLIQHQQNGNTVLIIGPVEVALQTVAVRAVGQDQVVNYNRDEYIALLQQNRIDHNNHIPPNNNMNGAGVNE
jgi:threonyl-tRNA synthetase